MKIPGALATNALRTIKAASPEKPVPYRRNIGIIDPPRLLGFARPAGSGKNAPPVRGFAALGGLGLLIDSGLGDIGQRFVRRLLLRPASRNAPDRALRLTWEILPFGETLLFLAVIR